jgi:hypothetical protein
MSTDTFTDRRPQHLTIDRVDRSDSGHVTLKLSSGWSFLSPVDSDHYVEGAAVVFENFGPNYVGGIRPEGSEEWIFRRSDQHFEQLAAETQAKWDQEKRDRLATNRVDWEKREAALPEWARARLARFRAAAGERFEVEGWGYELIICELAVIYERNGNVDDDEIDQYARVQGTSGNQHDVARVLARVLARSQDDAVLMPAGLSPLTGSADYSDVEPLRRALEKLKTRDEELTDVEHKDLTKALQPFLAKFAEILQSLGSAAEGAVESIDWGGLVRAVREDELEGDVIPLVPFVELTADEAVGWNLRGAARALAERGLHPDLVTSLMVVADELAPFELIDTSELSDDAAERGF